MKEFYPTIKDYKNMGLSDFQIDQLIKSENDKHGFHNYGQLNCFDQPHSLFFLDIKGTLYGAGGHGTSGLLGRAGDSNPIFLADIISLGSLLSKGIGQHLILPTYQLVEDNHIKIRYCFPEKEEDIKYKLDIPTSHFSHPIMGKGLATTKGPYKTIFISSDTMADQKDIILFLLLVYELHYNAATSLLFRIDGNKITELAELFEKCNRNMYVFMSQVSHDYSSNNTLMIFYDTIKTKVDAIMSQIVFLSSKDSGLTKGQLMEKYLESFNLENNLTFEDYNIFACGDNYSQDGEMIKIAFKYGGYGALNCLNSFISSKDETLRKILYLKYGIETRLPLMTYSFSEFYNRAVNLNSLERTWDLAETMHDINCSDETFALRKLRKTNHYVETSKD